MFILSKADPWDEFKVTIMFFNLFIQQFCEVTRKDKGGVG